MFCSKCGTNNENSSKFCSACGSSIVSMEMNPEVDHENNQPEFINTQATISQIPIQNGVNANMKQYAVLSVILPAIAFVLVILDGLSFYIAIVIASVGLSFAKKGEIADKKLSTIGKVLNYCLLGLAILAFISYILLLIINAI